MLHSNQEGVALLIICIVASIIFLSLIAHSYIFMRKKGSKAGGFTTEEVAHFKSGTVTIGSCADPIPDDLPYENQYEIAAGDYIVDKMKILGFGAFGIVYKGQVKDEIVAVKTTKPGSDKQSIKSLLSELKILIYVDKHPHIVNLVGAVTTGLKRGTIYVFVEWCPLGSLQDYLRKSRNCFVIAPTEGGEENEITLTNLFNWSFQITTGLLYLSSKKLIHGDLATRNVLLSNKDLAKITDFGLSRKIYDYTLYAKKNQEPLPWRWMAIESLRDMEFSVQSDVWSFGVTIWEIFTFAETPYAGLSWTVDFVEKLKQLRLRKPEYAPESLYIILQDCWKCDPKERPKADEIVTLMTAIMHEHGIIDDYLKMDI